MSCNLCKKQVVSVHKASLVCCILHRQGTYNRMYYHLLQPCMHAASGGLINGDIIGISVVGVIIIMVCSLNMVIAGGIKFRSYRTTNKTFRLKKNRK